MDDIAILVLFGFFVGLLAMLLWTILNVYLRHP